MAGAPTDKEKKQVQMTLVKPDKTWSVTFTHTNDCYKRHYAWIDGPFLFSSRGLATEFCRRKLMDFCADRLYDTSDEENKEKYEKIYEAFKETGRLYGVEQLTKDLAKGEFVSDTFDWDIKEPRVDEEEMPEVKTLDGSDEEEAEEEEKTQPPEGDKKKRATDKDSKEQPSPKRFCVKR